MIGWTVAAIAVATAATAIGWPRLRNARHARRLHAEFAAANSLSSGESAWLWQLAQSYGISDPLAVFVTPSVFDAHTAPGCVRAESVRSKLFGEDDPRRQTPAIDPDRD